MKKLIVILTILWFVGWGYWFLYERGHVLTSTNGISTAILSPPHQEEKNNVESAGDIKDSLSQEKIVVVPPKTHNLEEKIDSLVNTLEPGQIIQLISYYDPQESYQGKYENKGIARSMDLLGKVDKKYIDSLVYPVGLRKIYTEDSIKMDSFYQIKVFNNEQALQEINDKRYFIFFPYASDSEVAANKIEQVIDSLSKIWHDQELEFVITGHTDDQATESTNYLLGINRAKSLQQKLSKAGIPKGTIKILSKGESEPIASNLNPEGRYLNRRAEIILHSK